MSNECELQEEESRQRQKTISNSELKAKIKLGFGKIIDVRSKEEFDENHIDGAISIPIDELEGSLFKLEKKEELNIICDTGRRTKLAGKILEDNGFAKFHMVIPGMKDW